MKLAATLVGVLLLAGCGGGKLDEVKRKPVAAFTVIQSAARPQVVNLDATGSFTTVGSLQTYSWTFGDESGAPRTVLTTATTLHAYAAPGTYEVSLVVADEKGTESEPVTRPVTITEVNSVLPKAWISGPSSGTPNNALSYDGSGSTPAGDIQSYAWNFGDPASGTLNTVAGKGASGAQHAFTSAGSYRVTLTVTDSLGQSDTAELGVSIAAPGPVALCTFNPQPALLGLPVTFDASGSTPLVNSTLRAWLWDFGDGTQGTGVTAQHTYSSLATFKPKLQVIDSQNRLGEASCPDVVVTPAPLCDADYTLTANPSVLPGGCIGSDVTWGSNKVHLQQFPDGGMVGTETLASGLAAPDGGSTATYSGSYSGSAFTLKGKYVTTGMGSTETDVTVAGTLTGCGSFTGTWTEKLASSGFTFCTYSFTISGSRL